VHAAVPCATIVAMTDTAHRAEGRRRPFALYVLALLLLVKAGVLLALVFDVSLADDNLIRRALQVSPELGRFIQGLTASDIVLGVLAALLVGSAAGLVLLRRDGWLMAMGLTGLFVAGDIVGFCNGDVSYLWMALNIVTVFYLNQSDVRAAVGVSTEPVVRGLEV
jgi:hypothetical protein